MPLETKVCTECDVARPLTSFDKRRVCNRCRGIKQRAVGDTNWRRYFEVRLINANNRAPVTITADYLIEILVEQGGLCAMSGVRLTRLRGEMTKASIDRLDHTKAYAPGNVRLVTWAVNRMRNTMSDEEFMTWITALANTAARAHTVS